MRKKGSPPSRAGAWGPRAYTAAYRAHPDGAQKYRHPITGEVFEVDAVLSVAMLDRLNSIQGIEVYNVCAGHGVNAAGQKTGATLGFYANPDFGFWLIHELGRSRGLYAGLSLDASLTSGCGHSGVRGVWSVHLGCRAFDKHTNHVKWWELTTRTLERLVRRYRKPEQRLERIEGLERQQTEEIRDLRNDCEEDPAKRALIRRLLDDRLR